MPGNDSFTKLLCHGNGTDGSTSFTDSSALALTLTANGNSQVDTAQSKFGGASMLFDGSGDYIASSDHADLDLGTNDFAIDCWVRFPSTPSGNVTIFGRTSSGTSYMYLSLEGGSWRFRDYNSGNIIDFSRTLSMSANTWYHVAVTRSGSDFRMFLDGVQQGATYSNASSITARAVGIDIGAMTQNGAYVMNGWIDEFRYSNGDARWTSNFTPPTEEYDGSITVSVSPLTISSAIIAPTIKIDCVVTPSAFNILSTMVQPFAVGEVVIITPSAFNLTSAIIAPTIKIDCVVTPTPLNIVSNIENPIIPQHATFIASALNISSTLHNPIVSIVLTYSANAQKIISYNPLLFVTNTSPARIVKIDVTIPASPTWVAHILTGIDYAKNVFVNENTGFVYVVGANGKLLKILLSDLDNQTIIDLSDTDNLTTIMGLEESGFTYVGTDNALGELYQIDERNAFEINTDTQVLAPVSFQIDTDFTTVQSFGIDTETYGLGQNTFSIDTDFKCLSVVNDIIDFSDVHLYIDNIELNSRDLIIDSISLRHTLDAESELSFSLPRRHDELDKTLEGATVQITNQNAVKLIINGNIEFDGFIAEINPSYSKETERIDLIAYMSQPLTDYKNITLSLPSLNEKLSLYNVLIESPRIINPVIDSTNEINPKKYKGIRVSLGKQIKEHVLRYYNFDSFGTNATKIQDGTFIPQQNWTYFWTPAVFKPKFFVDNVIGTNFQPKDNNIPAPEVDEENPFHAIKLPIFQIPEFKIPAIGLTGQTTLIYFDYIGTSLAPVSSDIWVLRYAKYRTQRVYPNKEILLGEGSVIVSDFDSVVLVPSSTIFSALVSAGYINGGGVIQQSFKLILDYKDLNIDFSSKVLQLVYDIVSSKLGYTVGSAPFKNVPTDASGQYIPAERWEDRDNGLYSVVPESYNYIEYAKKIAELEYQKLLNINGGILPETSNTLTLTLDAYYYYNLKLLTRINIDNTTTPNIYNNNRGFPLGIKSINISIADMKVTLQADNLKSNDELNVIDGQYPDSTDSDYYTPERVKIIALKSDMQSRLKVE